MTGNWSDGLKGRLPKGAYVPQKPFPFEARHHHLADEFMRPFLRDLAKDGGPQRGLDPLGSAICRFMWLIADYQARRLASCDMQKCNPPAAPWLYRDLYQLDRVCDPEPRIDVAIPEAAVACFDADGQTWFLAWQRELHSAIGRGRALGRRPYDEPALRTMTPKAAYDGLAKTGWDDKATTNLQTERIAAIKGGGSWKSPV